MLLRAVIDHMPAMIGYWDSDCRNILANQAYVEWFGMSPEEIHGRHIREVLGESIYSLNLPYIEGVLSGQRQHFQRTIVDASGRTRYSQADYVPDIGDDGRAHGFFVLVADVTARVEAEQELARLTDELADMAATDALTGLGNRRGLEQAAATRLGGPGRRSGEPHHVALILIDLDGLKNVNDSFGHHVGDVVLMTVAERLRSAVRSDDVLVRLGGDEFVVLMSDSEGGGQALSLAARISDVMTEPIELDEVPTGPIGIGCSLGIAVVDSRQDGIPLRALLSTADGQMYRSKYASSNRPLSWAPVHDRG